jgi:hypothetical protein
MTRIPARFTRLESCSRHVQLHLVRGEHFHWKMHATLSQSQCPDGRAIKYPRPIHHPMSLCMPARRPSLWTDHRAAGRPGIVDERETAGATAVAPCSPSRRGVNGGHRKAWRCQRKPFLVLASLWHNCSP